MSCVQKERESALGRESEPQCVQAYPCSSSPPPSQGEKFDEVLRAGLRLLLLTKRRFLEAQWLVQRRVTQMVET